MAVELLIIVAAILLLVTLPLKHMQVPEPPGDVPSARIGVIGAASGMASGIAGAGWGPMGVTLLILSRIEPRFAVGSSVFGRIFMAAAAVVECLRPALDRFGQVRRCRAAVGAPAVILMASVATMLPGAVLTSRLGRTRMSVLIAAVSISLAVLALARTLFF